MRPVAAIGAPNAGAFEYVTASSPHVTSATGRTETPTEDPAGEYRRRVASTTGADTSTWNLR